MAIVKGTQVEATTAQGGTVLMYALGSPVRGDRFPIVWLATGSDWSRAQKAGEEPDARPWPVSAVHPKE